MYLLFRYHDWEPSKYKALGFNEKMIVKNFMSQEIKDRNEEISSMWGGGN